MEEGRVKKKVTGREADTKEDRRDMRRRMVEDNAGGREDGGGRSGEKVDRARGRAQGEDALSRGGGRGRRRWCGRVRVAGGRESEMSETTGRGGASPGRGEGGGVEKGGGGIGVGWTMSF